MLLNRVNNLILSAIATRLHVFTHQPAANPHANPRASAYKSSLQGIVSAGFEDRYLTLRNYGQLA